MLVPADGQPGEEPPLHGDERMERSEDESGMPVPGEYEESADEQVRSLAARRLAQIDSLDERERIGGVLADFKSRASRCPASWREVATALRAAGLKLDAAASPLDPAGFPYALDSAACAAKLDERSPIPKK